MDLSGPIFLLFTSLVATIYCLPDGLKSLPDASVFVMKPPKEFTDLFQPDDSKNLTNPMKSPFSDKNASHNLPDLSKILPDPSVFEMTPPREFLDLFRLKENGNVDAAKDIENLVDSKKESSNFKVTSVPDLPEPIVVDMKPTKESLDSATRDTENLGEPIIEYFNKVTNLPDKKYIPDPKVFEMKPPKEFLDLFQFRDKENLKENIISPIKMPSGDTVTTLSDEKSIPDPSVFEMKPPQEFTNLFHFKDKEELNKPLKWPSWSFEMSNNGQKMKFPDWFYLPVLKPGDKKKIDTLTEPNVSQKPQDIHWNQQTIESHSFYQQSPPVNKEFKPYNMFSANEGLSGFQNILTKNEEGNDIQVRTKDDSKTITDTKTEILKFTNDKTDKLRDITKGKTGDVTIGKSSAEITIEAPTKAFTILIENKSHDKEGESTNKYLDSIIFPEDEILVKKDTTEVKPVEFKSNDKVSLVDKPEDKQSESPPKISVLDNSIFVPVQLMQSPHSQHYGLGNSVFMSTLYPSQNYGLPMLNVQMPSQGYGFEYTNQPNYQIDLSPLSSEVKPDSLPLSGNVVQDLSLPSDKPKSVYDLLQTQNVKPNDFIISSIKHSSKDNDPSGSHVTAMILPSKAVPQTRSIISGNNMVINNGDKLANVDQTINGTPAPNAYNFPSHGESNQESFVSNARPETSLIQGNIPNSPPLLGQSVNYSTFGSNGNMLSPNNYHENQKPETISQGNIPVTSPNLGYPVNYPPFVSNNNNIASQSNKYPQNQQPVFVNVPYGSHRGPLNYVLANGALLNGQMTNTQNYQLNSGQSMMVPSPMVEGYNQNNLYALVPISKPNPYLNNNVNGNGYHQVSGQVFNLVPAQNNVLLTTKDEDDL